MRVHYSRALYRAFWFDAATHLPVWLGVAGTRRLGKVVGTLFWLTHPRMRANVRANLALLNPAPVTDRLVRRTFANYGATLADYFVLGSRSKALVTEQVGFDELKRSYDKTQGAVVVTVHLGLFELGGVLMQEFGLPTVILSLPEPSPALGQWRARYRKRWDVDTLEVGDDWLSSLAVIRKLREGHFVAMLVDRPYNQNYVLVKFPNGQVPFSTGPVWLSLLSGRPIIPVTVVALADGRYRLEAHPPLRTQWLADGRTETVQHFTQQLGVVFRDTICQHPDQWYQFAPLSY